MPIFSTLSPLISKVLFRKAGSVFVRTAGGTVWTRIGVVNQLLASGLPMSREDTQGRTLAGGFDLTARFDMRETDPAKFAAAYGLVTTELDVKFEFPLAAGGTEKLVFPNQYLSADFLYKAGIQSRISGLVTGYYDPAEFQACITSADGYANTGTEFDLSPNYSNLLLRGHPKLYFSNQAEFIWTEAGYAQNTVFTAKADVYRDGRGRSITQGYKADLTFDYKQTSATEKALLSGFVTTNLMARIDFLFQNGVREVIVIQDQYCEVQPKFAPGYASGFSFHASAEVDPLQLSGMFQYYTPIAAAGTQLYDNANPLYDNNNALLDN